MARKAYCPYHGPWNGCPGGVEMKHYWTGAPFGGKVLHWYECPVCDNGAPTADTEYGAWLNAIRLFIPQKPLDMELLDDPAVTEGGLWLEYKGVPLHCVHIIDAQASPVMIQVFGKMGEWPLEWIDYGSKWRLWARKPTDEEIEDAPWEGGGNE